jgi:hypothetical protein
MSQRGSVHPYYGPLSDRLLRPNINCESLYTFTQFAGDAAVGLASINLAIRVVAIYKSDKRVMAALFLLICGQ